MEMRYVRCEHEVLHIHAFKAASRDALLYASHEKTNVDVHLHACTHLDTKLTHAITDKLSSVPAHQCMARISRSCTQHAMQRTGLMRYSFAFVQQLPGVGTSFVDGVSHLTHTLLIHDA